MDSLARFKAAAIQAKPVWLDKAATVAKACRLIDEAASDGNRLIVFPEAWIPTFPYWPRALSQPDKQLSTEAYVGLYHQAVDVPGPETEAIGEAARRAGATVVIGINERDRALGNTLFNSLLYFAVDGGLIGHHRKLMPTWDERAVWGIGDGTDLAVYDTPVGRLGGLICGNNSITLAKYYLLTQGEQVHVAVWPNRHSISEMAELVARGYALEGQVFVVSACGIMDAADVPDDFPLKSRTVWDMDGGSGIVGPNGRWLAGPVYGREAIVSAEIDLDRIIAAKANQDVVGHYGRPDLFRLEVRRGGDRWRNVVGEATPGSAGGAWTTIDDRGRGA
jgi:predicted amidohydrolase